MMFTSSSSPFYLRCEHNSPASIESDLRDPDLITKLASIHRMAVDLFEGMTLSVQYEHAGEGEGGALSLEIECPKKATYDECSRLNDIVLEFVDCRLRGHTRKYSIEAQGMKLAYAGDEIVRAIMTQHTQVVPFRLELNSVADERVGKLFFIRDGGIIWKYLVVREPSGALFVMERSVIEQEDAADRSERKLEKK